MTTRPAPGQVTWAKVRKHRKEAFERIGDRPNVVGSMIGLKYEGGLRSDRLGLTVFVRQKVEKGDLPPKHRIPKFITVEGVRIPTDVMVRRPMVEQGLERANILFDQAQHGTLSCFGIDGDDAYGVSCAHCLLGVDGNPATPTPVQMWDAPQTVWRDAGNSVYSVYSPGTGIRGDFGYLDCGLFSLEDTDLQSRASQATELPIVTDLADLFMKTVVGISIVPVEGYNQYRYAKVIGVEVDALDGYSDLYLDVAAPGTFHGNSGMMWFTLQGEAAGIHARGEDVPPGYGSKFTTAMSAVRVAVKLGIQFAAG